MKVCRSQFFRLLGAGLLVNRSLAAEANAAGPTVRIGILTDCQYANVDTPPKSKRQYRKSPGKLTQAVTALNKMRDLDFVIHLGDMIDRDFASFEAVMPIFRKLKAPRYQVLGNHDYSVTDGEKAGVPAALGMERRYFAWAQRGWKFIVLDGTEISLFSSPKDSEAWKAADAFRRASKRKLADYNGGIGAAQTAFLKDELTAARSAGQKALIFCHYPLLPVDAHALWNAEEVLDLLKGYQDVVVAWFNGHNHDGNYAARHGIHCLNFRGMVDTDRNCYARVELFADRIEVYGYGREPSRVMTFPAPDAIAESERQKNQPQKPADVRKTPSAAS